jgi:uncharacterized repeat protein (TIGR01451 family)
MTLRANPIRAIPITVAFLLNMVVGPLAPLAQQGITRAANDGIDDYAQCQIGNGAGLDCAEETPAAWTNGILNDTHNDYAEDEVVPQRLQMGFTPGSSHSVTIRYMTRKDSSGQRHAYDYLATYNYTYVNADRCQELPSGVDCVGGSPTTFPIPSDPNNVSPGGPQPTSAHELPQADRQFTMYGGTITGVSNITHAVDPNEAGSDYGILTVTFTVGSGGNMQLLWGGHLASGFGPRGWGQNLGAAAISGGPYHMIIDKVDGESIGQRDNQIMSNAIEPLLPTLTISKTPDGGEVTAGDYASFTITVTNNGPGAATNVDVDDTLPAGTAGNLVWEESPDKAECTVVSNVLHCDIASLADDASFSVTVRALTDADDCGALDNTAFADADNNPAVSDVGDITVLCGDIAVDKTPDGGEVTAGDTASFTIVTSNNGDGAAKGSELSDVLPAVENGWSVSSEDWAGDCTITGAAGDPQTLACGPEDIPAGASRSVTVEAVTTGDDCGLLDNPLAEASTTNDGSDDDAGDITVLCGDIGVDKTPDGAVINATDDASFTIVTSNSGDGEARGASLSDVLPAVDNGWSIDSEDWAGDCTITGAAGAAQTLACGPEDIEAGGSRSVTVVATTTTDDCGLLDNPLAEATTTNDGSASDAGDITVRCPDLDAIKVAAADVVSAGQPIGFTITVSNSALAGTGTAYNVQLSDPLPAGAALDWSEDPDNADCSISGATGAEVLSCSFGDLAPGESHSVHIVSGTSQLDCATYPNVAEVTADNHATLNPSDDVTVECPGLNISKVADNGEIVAGDIASYTIMVWNAGPGTAFGASWSDDLPHGVSWSIDLQNPDNDDACASSIDSEGNQGASCTFGDLLAGESKTIVVSGLTDREDCAGLENTAFAFASNDDTVQASARIDVRCPELVIDKAADTEVVHFVFDPDGNLKSVDPEQVTWTLTYTLTDGPVTNAVITDPLPDFLVFVSASDGGVYDDATRTITWNLGDLTVDGSDSVSFVTTVDPDAPETDPIVNVASIVSNETPKDDGEDSIRVTSESELGGNPTPTPSVPNTAVVFGPDGQPISIPVELLVLVFFGSLGVLAFANVRAVRRGR